jgi:hypothetical protein
MLRFVAALAVVVSIDILRFDGRYSGAVGQMVAGILHHFGIWV